MLALITFTLLLNITYYRAIGSEVLQHHLGIGIENHKQNVQAQKDKSLASNIDVDIIDVSKVNSPSDAGHDNPHQIVINEKTKQTSSANKDNEIMQSINENKNDHKAVLNNNTGLKQDSSKTNSSSTLPAPPPILIPVKDEMQSGALLRGFYVFLGLSVVIMVYFIFRSYRLRHGSQPSTTVRKYGVTARRSDMEMRPLELDDDDDDTLFEIGNRNTVR